MFVRIYTGDDGQSHFEELDLDAGPVEWSTDGPATGIAFRRGPVGEFLDWHPAPRRQWVITLSGVMEIAVGDGTSRRFGPGDVMLAEDVEGQGHTLRAIGDEPRISALVPLP